MLNVQRRSLHVLMRSRNRKHFLTEVADRADVLDVGCGNDSPYLFKSVRPDIRYVGLDVGDYQQGHTPTDYADEYIVVPPERFLAAIQERSNQYDAVVSSHNLEHCMEPDAVVTAMARALRPGGRVFLAFPSAATVDLPSRGGTLNFFDDSTHTQPPNFQRVLDLLRSEGIRIDFSAERHRSPAWVAVGLLSEPISRLRKTVMRGTWALYGFETIIWGTKVA